ncbi:MAG: PHP domain-containing protein [Clostridia bacterium]|nr:PHP domain-containing protein [Clostridia bacterium]
MKLCDLHTHSIYSDGTSTPAELIKLAKGAGLSAIALTDHNTVSGIPHFLKAAEGSDVIAVPGIEVSSDYLGNELHIVGLFRSLDHLDEVEDYVAAYLERKEQSNIDLCCNLTADGYEVSYEKVKSATPDGTVNRALIAAELMRCGYVESIKAAFATLLSKKGGYYHEPEKLNAFDVITKLGEFDAIPILAHPFLSLDEAQLHSFLPKAKAAGLIGMETDYSTFDQATTAQAHALAEKYGLLPSGGSDYHGTNKPDISVGTGKGSLLVPFAYYENLVK